MTPDDPPSSLAPAETRALAASGDGRALRRAEGAEIWQLAPPAAQQIVRAASWVPLLVVGAGVVAALVWSRVQFWWLLIGKGGLVKVGLLGAGAAGAKRAAARIGHFWVRRLARLYAAGASRTALQDGGFVLLRGRVRSEGPFVAAVSGAPAVFAHYEIRPSEGARVETVRGIDFALQLEDGTRVHVPAEECLATDGARGPWTIHLHRLEPLATTSKPPTYYREGRIGPGDLVEAIGTLERQVDPTGERDSHREPPMRLALRASRRAPIFLRRLAD